jgi:hypothetical protein
MISLQRRKQKEVRTKGRGIPFQRRKQKEVGGRKEWRIPQLMQKQGE